MRLRGRDSWQLRFYLGTDPGTGRPRWHSKTVHGTQRFASRQLEVLEAEASRARIRAGTLSDLLDRWLEAASPGWSASTVTHTLHRRVPPQAAPRPPRPGQADHRGHRRLLRPCSPGCPVSAGVGVAGPRCGRRGASTRRPSEAERRSPRPNRPRGRPEPVVGVGGIFVDRTPGATEPSVRPRNSGGPGAVYRGSHTGSAVVDWKDEDPGLPIKFGPCSNAEYDPELCHRS